ncbi:hypothetical protein [Aquihabitans sp. McL0605]|uniref:hypothetical protein n=1 Tax=Aquihabitans sp. McL0605 TaxID=3415671 RepID=UPI003CE6F56D
MKSRGVAVIGAFLLIVVALTLRNQVAGSDGDGATKGHSGGGKPVVACSPDLASVCAALADDGTIADHPPSLDLDHAAEPPAGIDGWITWSPAPQIANFDAGSTKVWGPPEVLGSAAAAVLIDPDSIAALPAACRAKPTWSCLGAAAPDLSIGVGDPATAEGIARLAPFARARTTDDDPAQLDVEGLSAIVTSPQDPQADAGTMAERLTTKVGSLSMVAGANDLLLAQTRSSQGQQRRLRVLSPSPAHRLTVVITDRVGGGTGGAVSCKDDSTAAALTDLGIQPCEGTDDAALAGFLFQVQKKVG